MSGPDDEEDYVLLVFALRPLFPMQQILDGQGMRPQHRRYLGQLVLARFVQAQPHERAGRTAGWAYISAAAAGPRPGLPSAWRAQPTMSFMAPILSRRLGDSSLRRCKPGRCGIGTR